MGGFPYGAVTYHVRLHRELANQLDAYAAEQRVTPETIIAEALRAYLGVGA